MSDLADAVETMMAALSDAMDVWRSVGDRVERAERLAESTVTAVQTESGIMWTLKDRLDAIEKERVQVPNASIDHLRSRIESEVNKLCGRLDAIELRMDRVQAQRAPDFGQMFRGVGGRLDALEKAVAQLRQDVIK